MATPLDAARPYPPTAASPPPATSTAATAAIGVLGFLVLGVLTSALGPTLPLLRSKHGLDAAQAGLLLTAFSAGAALGVMLAGALRRRLPVSALLSVGAGAVALGCGAAPLAGSAAAAEMSILLAGIGLGVVDLLLNLVLARAGAALLMAVSATFGVSAIGTPLMIGAAPQTLALPYLVCGGGALVLAVAASRLRVPPDTRRVAAAGGKSADPSTRTTTVALLAVVLLGYVTVEGGVAGWETTHLQASTSLSDAAAAQAVALLWAGITLGRLLTAPLAARMHPGSLVLAALTAGTLALLLATSAPAAVWAYALAGLCIAPVFPAVVAWHSRHFADGRGLPALFAVGLAGPVATSPLIGVAADARGASAIPVALAVLAAATALVTLFARIRRQPSQ
jgi:fucose permease